MSSGRAPRLMVFADRPDALVIYLPEGETLRLPPLTSPFTKSGVAVACGESGLDVRVADGKAGRWTAAYTMLRKAERSERGQRQRLEEAAKITKLRESASPIAVSRAEAIEHKHAVDEQIRDLKNKLGEAKSRAYTTGQYISANEFRGMEQRLHALKDESQALQTRIGELRDAEKIEHQAVADVEHRLYAKRFLKAARSVLSEDLLQKLHGLAQDEETDDGL